MDSYTNVRGQCCGCGHGHETSVSPARTKRFSQPVHADTADSLWSSWSQPEMCPYQPVSTQPAAVSPASSFLCPQTEAGPLEQNHAIAMAYVPWQQWQTTYAPEHGLMQGTIFPELDLQFNYGRCGR